jgi:hypothetical protein
MRGLLLGGGRGLLLCSLGLIEVKNISHQLEAFKSHN